jgi:hypothetical protein
VLRQQIANGHELRVLGVVSDEGCLGPALRILSVMVPGTTRGFPVADLEAAKSWVAET